jgi:hypothetical protein
MKPNKRRLARGTQVAERRRYPRLSIDESGLVALAPGALVRPCAVHNLSPEGVRMTIRIGEEELAEFAPGRGFVLSFPAGPHRIQLPCRVAWITSSPQVAVLELGAELRLEVAGTQARAEYAQWIVTALHAIRQFASDGNVSTPAASNGQLRPHRTVPPKPV